MNYCESIHCDASLPASGEYLLVLDRSLSRYLKKILLVMRTVLLFPNVLNIFMNFNTNY